MKIEIGERNMNIEEELEILRKAYILLAESYHKQMCSGCDCPTCIGCFYRKEKLEQLFIKKAIVAIDKEVIKSGDGEEM